MTRVPYHCLLVIALLTLRPMLAIASDVSVVGRGNLVGHDTAVITLRPTASVTVHVVVRATEGTVTAATDGIVLDVAEAGIALGPVSQAGPAALGVDVTLQPSILLGAKDLVLLAPAAGTAERGRTTLIVRAPAPVITSVSINGGLPSLTLPTVGTSTMPITVTGSGFYDGMRIAFADPNVLVDDNPPTVTPNAIQTQITVDPTKLPDVGPANFTITDQFANPNRTGQIMIVGANAPTITGHDPQTFVADGISHVLALQGKQFSPRAQLGASHPGVIIDGVTVAGPGDLQARIKVPPQLAHGTVMVTVTNPDHQASNGEAIALTGQTKPVQAAALGAASKFYFGHPVAAEFSVTDAAAPRFDVAQQHFLRIAEFPAIAIDAVDDQRLRAPNLVIPLPHGTYANVDYLDEPFSITESGVATPWTGKITVQLPPAPTTPSLDASPLDTLPIIISGSNLDGVTVMPTTSLTVITPIIANGQIRTTLVVAKDARPGSSQALDIVKDGIDFADVQVNVVPRPAVDFVAVQIRGDKSTPWQSGIVAKRPVRPDGQVDLSIDGSRVKAARTLRVIAREDSAGAATILDTTIVVVPNQPASATIDLKNNVPAGRNLALSVFDIHESGALPEFIPVRRSALQRLSFSSGLSVARIPLDGGAGSTLNDVNLGISWDLSDRSALSLLGVDGSFLVLGHTGSDNSGLKYGVGASLVLQHRLFVGYGWQLSKDDPVSNPAPPTTTSTGSTTPSAGSSTDAASPVRGPSKRFIMIGASAGLKIPGVSGGGD